MCPFSCGQKSIFGGTIQSEMAKRTVALIEKFKTLIAANGTVDSVDEWGKRRFAYEINKETEGYYTLINFTCAPSFTAELDRVYKITDGVLRSLIVKKEA